MFCILGVVLEINKYSSRPKQWCDYIIPTSPNSYNLQLTLNGDPRMTLRNIGSLTSRRSETNGTHTDLGLLSVFFHKQVIIAFLLRVGHDSLTCTFTALTYTNP